MKSGGILSFVHCLLLLLPFLVGNVWCITDTITAAQVLNDGQTIISDGGSFELGFFSPGNSTKRYLGIWYKNITVHTVVWVANREHPLNTTKGTLEVIKPGFLVLRASANNTIWSSNYSITVRNPVARLLDSGNLVVKDANNDDPENFLWQSFDYPTDTYLPGMKLGRNFVTGRDVYITSWKSADDPSPGEFTYSLDSTGYPQKKIKKGTVLTYRTGPWNGIGWNGVPGLIGNNIFTFEVVYNSKEIYYSYQLLSSTLSKFTLAPSGVGQRWTWEPQSTDWKIYLSAPGDNCDSYARCGPYGSCDVTNSSICGCLDKFQPKNPANWAKGQWSDGCIRVTPLDCGKGDGFLKFSNYKLPNVENSTFYRNISLDDCKNLCFKDCTCTAYSSLDVRNGGSGCLLWYGDLIDMKVTTAAGQDIYIWMASVTNT